MRKVMLLAAMLAMVLAAAAPVLAQDVNVETGDDVEYNAACQNIIGALGDITGVQAGAASATAVDDSEAIAEVAQEQNVSVAQVNECLNNFATVTATSTSTSTAKKTATATATVAAKGQYGVKKKVIFIHGKKFVVVGGKTVMATTTATAKKTASATSSATSSATAKATLPDTGGAPLLALGAGVLLVGGGLLARRIAR